MGKITATKKLVIEDFNDQRPWIQKLIIPINQFFEQIYFTLVSGITLKDNMKAQVFDVTLPIDYVYTERLKLAWRLNERPTSVFIGWAREDAADPAVIGNHSLEWVFNNGTLEVLFNGFVDTKKYNIRIVGQV